LREVTVGRGVSFTSGIVTSRSVREEDENRIEARKGTGGGVEPEGLVENEAKRS